MNAKRRMLGLVLAAATAATVCAADRTWDGGSAANSNFSTADNWDGDTQPAFDGSTRAVFGASRSRASMSPLARAGFRAAASTDTLWRSGVSGTKARLGSLGTCRPEARRTMVIGP